MKSCLSLRKNDTDLHQLKQCQRICRCYIYLNNRNPFKKGQENKKKCIWGRKQINEKGDIYF